MVGFVAHKVIYIRIEKMDVLVYLSSCEVGGSVILRHFLMVAEGS